MQDFILIQPSLKVSFKRWVSTDKTTLESVTMPVEEFPNFFVQQISTLRSHHFIAREQQAAVRKRKEELRDGEETSLKTTQVSYRTKHRDIIGTRNRQLCTPLLPISNRTMR